MQRRLSESTEKYEKVKKKLLWSYRLCWIFRTIRFSWECPQKTPKGHFARPTKNEHFSWERPQKQDKSKFHEKVKIRLCIVNNRRWPPPQDLQKRKNWRIHITGYQRCKSSIWWKNAKSYDLRCLPRRLTRSAKRRGAPRGNFLRKLL